ncbi:hypothetical protein [Legionella gresilensis]|uniref:hypothetical protein n=1 Tax=Legionella gresilensis TaxID=91823 RepID=UPI0010414CDD|nr:hypothetical protein [Legionella gresilensis]
MKKAKEIRQPISESITAGEPKISSIAFALQQFKKEEEKKALAEETAKTRCPVCFKEIAPKRLCSGHGGGSSRGDSTITDKKSEEKVSSYQDNALSKLRKVVETENELGSKFDLESLEEKFFNPEIIESLIAQGRLLIDSDRASMTLTVKLLCEPNSLTGEQKKELKKFIEAILKDFNKFKEENHLTNDHVHITQDESNILSLRISAPTLILYDAFTQRLANSLVPIAQEKATSDQGLAHHSPSMESKSFPSTTREKIENNNKKQEIFNPSPFKTQPW